MNHLIEFQKKHGLSPDGIIGKLTLAKMRSVFGIASNSGLAHFLANVDHETGGFTADSENLNYNAAGLAKTWPQRYADPVTRQPNALANKLARNPEAIANNAYANRMGNGSEASGDGWKFRGRGSLQLTGKQNYNLFSAFIGDASVMTNPDIVATKYFWDSALFYFSKNNLWQKTNGTSPVDVKAIRKAVNGGYIGLEDVQKKFEYYIKLTGK